MDDRANAERADDAAGHNALSGKARSVAQAHTVFGGVHMYDTSRPPAQRSLTPSRGAWVTNSLAIFAIGVSLISLLLTLRRITFPVLAGPSVPTSALPRESGPASEDVTGIAEMEIPSRRDDGRLDHLVEVPEIAHAYSFQAYQ